MANKLLSALRRRYHSLSKDEAELLFNKILETIAERLVTGERLAFMKDNSDGSWDLSIFDLEVRDPEVNFSLERMESAEGKKVGNLFRISMKDSTGHHENHLSFEVELPGLISFDDFFNIFATLIKPIDFLYSIFAIIGSGLPAKVHGFLNYLKHNKNIAELEKSDLEPYLEEAKIQPLRIVLSTSQI
jgi:hypothetical protein